MRRFNSALHPHLVGAVPRDKHGKEFVLGKKAKHPCGKVGEIIFLHCALRVVIPGYKDDANVNLVYSDTNKPEHFVVL